jgi:hypothetical protein
MSKVEVKYKEVKRPIIRVIANDSNIKDRALVIQPSQSIKNALTVYVSGVNNSRVRISRSDVPELLNAISLLNHNGEFKTDDSSTEDLVVTFKKGNYTHTLNLGDFKKPVTIKEWGDYRDKFERVIGQVLRLSGDNNE